MSSDNIEQIMRLILRLVDLSRDLERNKDDALFARDGGQIFYVFDATVFEVFIRPDDRRGRLTSIYGRDWIGGAIGGHAKRNALSYASQSAMLTAEFLASGSLPGQAEPRLFMTQLHRWELGRRLMHLNERYAKVLANANEDEMRQRFDVMRRVLKAYPKPVDLLRSDADFSEDEADLRKSLENSRSSRSVIDDVMRAFVATRIAVKVLAEDTKIEPAEQLLRVVKPPLRDRIQTLHLYFRAKPEELEQIGRDYPQWRRRLVEECRRQGVEIQNGDKSEHARTKAALRDDAQSLAFVQWAASNRVREKQRLVFVTADDILFDAYRRWYSNLDPRDPAYGEPFCLRRITQYAPVFNLSDSNNVLRGDAHFFFEQLLGVLEMTLMPLNLSRLRASALDEGKLARMRELTALRVLDPQSVADDLSYMPLRDALIRKTIDGEVRALLDRWLRLERAAIGLADNHFKVRLSQKERSWEEFNVLDEANKDEADFAFKNYISKLIRTLENSTREMWLPLACEFIETWQPRSGQLPRAPIPFMLEIKVDDEIVGLGARLDEKLSGGDEPVIPHRAVKPLQDAPELLFAVAAALSLASDDWSNADRYAEMAYGWASRNPSKSSDQYYELCYLNALTKRFRIGAFAPALNVEAYDRIKFIYSAAQKLLNACIDYHKNQHGVAPKLRHMRALSERAALHLFFSAAIAPAVREAFLKRVRQVTALSGTRAYEQQQYMREAIHATKAAEADLNSFLTCEAELPPRTNISDEKFFGKLERQVLVNVAAQATLRRLLEYDQHQEEDDTELGSRMRFKRPNLLVRVSRLLNEWSPSSVAASALLRAEMYAFLAMDGDQEAYRSLRTLRGKQGDTTVSLDRALLSAILEGSERFHP